MAIEKPNFEKHQGGMPSAAELRWRQAVERAEFDARYYPFGRGETPTVFDSATQVVETPTAEGMPRTGTIDNFRAQPVEPARSADALLMRGMMGMSFTRPPR